MISCYFYEIEYSQSQKERTTPPAIAPPFCSALSWLAFAELLGPELLGSTPSSPSHVVFADGLLIVSTVSR
jgi:hypothetical protein